jgi:hypothetical protein
MQGMEDEMKILVEFDLSIDGKCPRQKVHDNFLEWVKLANWKISPDSDDDDYQVWVDKMRVK